MNPNDAIALYALLVAHGVAVCVDGGWGVDALLGQQTRPHKDLDLFVWLADLSTLAAVLAEHGFAVN